MAPECCVPGCYNRGGHAFPKNEQRRSSWMKLVRRLPNEHGQKYWHPSKYTVVCSAHFEESDYVETTWAGTVPQQRKLKATAAPHLFSWNNPCPSAGSVARNKRVSKRQKLSDDHEEQIQERLEEMHKQREKAVEYVCANEVIQAEDIIESTEEATCNDKATQTTFQWFKAETRNIETQTTMPWFCVAKYSKDDESIHFYTGMASYGKFCLLLEILGPAANELTYIYDNGSRPSLSTENQLFLALMKLRRHTTDFELGRFFEISEKSVSNIYITWINFIASEFSELDFWPSRDLVHYFMPKDFQSKFPTTRVILDGAECPIQKPKQPIAQQATFSSYKNRNTIKVVAGATPGGVVSYLSQAYGGSTSDRQILERGSITRSCDPGDSVMVDKGFNVQDLFVPANVELNIPTFFRKTNRLSNSVIIKDRKIASKRVHIERIIGLAKTFKILTEPLNNTESTLATKITQLCFFLCNFRSCIISSDA